MKNYITHKAVQKITPIRELKKKQLAPKYLHPLPWSTA